MKAIFNDFKEKLIENKNEMKLISEMSESIRKITCKEVLDMDHDEFVTYMDKAQFIQRLKSDIKIRFNEICDDYDEFKEDEIARREVEKKHHHAKKSPKNRLSPIISESEIEQDPDWLWD